MELPWTPEFAEEVARSGLRYTCPDCVYFLEASRTCLHEWPQCETLATHDAARPAAEVVFCKEFEIR